LFSLAMVGILVLLYAVFMFVTVVARSLPALISFGQGSQVVEISVVRRTLQTVAAWGGVFLLFLGVYRWVPAPQVGWTSAAWSAGAATVLWQIATNVFVWVLRMGFSRYELIYGTLGTVVALLFLVYLNAWIVLFGAHLCASLMKNGV
jgi:membrane protein